MKSRQAFDLVIPGKRRKRRAEHRDGSISAADADTLSRHTYLEDSHPHLTHGGTTLYIPVDTQTNTDKSH